MLQSMYTFLLLLLFWSIHYTTSDYKTNVYLAAHAAQILRWGYIMQKPPILLAPRVDYFGKLSCIPQLISREELASISASS